MGGASEQPQVRNGLGMEMWGMQTALATLESGLVAYDSRTICVDT